jgi:hypothetical protein
MPVQARGIVSPRRRVPYVEGHGGSADDATRSTEMPLLHSYRVGMYSHTKRTSSFHVIFLRTKLVKKSSNLQYVVLDVLDELPVVPVLGHLLANVSHCVCVCLYVETTYARLRNKQLMTIINWKVAERRMKRSRTLREDLNQRKKKIFFFCCKHQKD